MVSQNNYQSKHLQYRSIETPETKLAKAAAALEAEMAGLDGAAPASFNLLWTFISEEKTSGRNVSCLEWNEGNPDLLERLVATDPAQQGLRPPFQQEAGRHVLVIAA